MTSRPSSFLALSAMTVLLSACSAPPAGTTSIDQQNINPLVAERYGNELADMLADLIIQNDPIVEDAGVKDGVQRGITKAKAIARVGREDRARGQYGAFIPINEDAGGEALYLDKRLYFSSTFFTEPGPSLHVFLTTDVDPRDATFPNAEALDLGPIQTTYGAQTYVIAPDNEAADLYRTAVLWDTDLQRLFSFAQLAVR